MSRLRSVRWTVLLLCALACVLPARALASSDLKMSMEDDGLLVYSSATRAIKTLEQMKALGVDQVKVTLIWNLVAPHPKSSHRPKFNATDPGAYGSDAWGRYDMIVQEAHALGMSVSFIIVPPAPTWAIPRSHYREGSLLGHAPYPADFRQFVQAAGARYNGSYEGLPRVGTWEIWNEPNFPAWLNPYYSRTPRGAREYIGPMLYRQLVDAASNGLAATGHTPATDTILIGETVSPGDISGGAFDRGLYCIGQGLHRLTGAAAQQWACPTSGNATAFVKANPGLFRVSGFAYHPYSFNLAPNIPYPLPNWITMQNLGSLEHLLVGAYEAYGQLPRSHQVPLYLTEFGYESDPPNPYVQNSTTQQATWINEVEYMAWKDSYVKTLNQFELVDSRPRHGAKPGSRAYWATFQTGLEFQNGKPKPALAAFRLPIWLPSERHGSSVAVWGQLRPADHTTRQTGLIEYQPRGSGTWQAGSGDLVSTTNSEGFFFDHVPIPSAGRVRLAWADPSGTVYYSRSVPVS
jgi:hypothetical protein